MLNLVLNARPKVRRCTQRLGSTSCHQTQMPHHRGDVACVIDPAVLRALEFEAEPADRGSESARLAAPRVGVHLLDVAMARSEPCRHVDAVQITVLLHLTTVIIAP